VFIYDVHKIVLVSPCFLIYLLWTSELSFLLVSDVGDVHALVPPAEVADELEGWLSV